MPVVESEARAYYESGDQWRDRVAYLAMPIMLWCAKNGRTITYGQLAEEIQRRHGEERKFPTLYGWVAGKLGTITDAIGEEWGSPIPPINALVVNKATKLPSSGVDSWLEHYLYVTKEEHVTAETRDAVAQMVIDDVFDFPHWDEVAAHLGIKRLPRVKVLEEEDLEPITLPKPVVIRGGGGESEQHRQLKEWVAAHPERFAEYGSFRHGQMEALLHSGDEVDVLFVSRSTLLAVEVKAANAPDSELRRGLFQCVKYKAVLRATRLVQGESPTAQAILVTQRRLPEEMAKMARRLGVRCLVL